MNIVIYIRKETYVVLYSYSYKSNIIIIIIIKEFQNIKKFIFY